MKWSLSQWLALPELEQELWLDFEEERRRAVIHKMLDMVDKEINTPEVMVQLWIELGIN